MRCLPLSMPFITKACLALAHHHHRAWTMATRTENTTIQCRRAPRVSIPPPRTRTRLLPLPPRLLVLHLDAQAIIDKLHLLSLAIIIQPIPTMVLYRPRCRLLPEMKVMSLHLALRRARIYHLRIATVQRGAVRANEEEIIEDQSRPRQIHHLGNLSLSLLCLGFMIFHKNAPRTATLLLLLLHLAMLDLQARISHNQRLCRHLFLIRHYSYLLHQHHHHPLPHRKIAISRKQRKHSLLRYYKSINPLGVKYQLLLA